MEPADVTTETDESLVVATLSDARLFVHIVTRYEAKLRRYLSRLGVSAHEDQDDLLQDIFIRVYEHLNGFDVTMKFSSWIYRIAHNVTISSFRKRSASAHGNLANVSDEDLHNLASELNTNHEAEEREAREALRAAMAALDPQYREIVVLKYFEYKSYDEIADILMVPEGTVATWLNRAKKDLRTFMSTNKYTYGNK